MSDDRPTPRGFQFGLRHLIVAMVVLSVVFALLFATPDWIAIATAIVMSTLAGTMLTAAIVYGRANVRAFCIGALFPVAVVSLTAAIMLVLVVFGELNDLVDNANNVRAVTVAWVIASCIAGTLSVIVRRYLSRGE